MLITSKSFQSTFFLVRKLRERSLGKHTLVFALMVIALLPSEMGFAEEFKIGVIQSLRGIAAQDGNTVVRSLRIAAEQARHFGSHISLLIEDDGSNPQESITAYQRLKSEGVKVIVGATWNFLTNPLAPLAARDGIILLNTSVPVESLSLAESGGMLFTLSPSIRAEANQFEKFARDRKLSTAAILHVDNSWGQSQADIYQAEAKRLGLSVIAIEHTVGNDDSDLRSIIQKIARKKPDVVLLFLNESNLENSLRRAAEIHFAPKIFTSKNLFDAFASSTTKQQFEGVCFPYPLRRLREATILRKQYVALYHEEPRIYADTSYDSVFLIIEAQKRSMQRQIPFVDALKQASFEGVSGVVNYSNDQSFSSSMPSLVCIQDGRMTEIE